MQEYEKAKDGESFELALEVVKPEISITDLNDELFKDVLGTYETKYDKYYTTRAENLRLAASKINGKILYPGEIFSYNEVVGERTVAAGYKMAHVFAGGRVIDGLGGGICQVSTTLYNAVVLANLEIVERKAHQMHTGYVQPGRDATVVYGTIDFKFKNNRDLPIKIVCSVVDGVNKFEIFGIKKDTDPTVEFETKILNTVYPKTINENDATMDVGTTKVVQSPMNGYTSETYKILKNSAGEQISRTLLSKDVYQVTNKIVKVGTKPIAPVVPETPVEENQPVVTPPAVEEPILPPGWDSPESPYVQ
jgi:vancomycin resistance protein YoaR